PLARGCLGCRREYGPSVEHGLRRCLAGEGFGIERVAQALAVFRRDLWPRLRKHRQNVGAVRALVRVETQRLTVPEVVVPPGGRGSSQSLRLGAALRRPDDALSPGPGRVVRGR